MDHRLLTIGFESADEWTLDGERIKTRFDRNAEQKNVLYAFFANEEVMYVGQSERTLRERMGN
jgi:hypothetical protein